MSPPTRFPSMPAGPGGTKAAGRVLVVDDDGSVARIIALMARQSGHEATIAASVDEARTRLAEGVFDVVLTDLDMKQFGGPRGGFDILTHVRETSPDVPVVVITGQATIDTAMEAIRDGAYDYLAKPVQLDVLEALLRRAIEKKQMAEQVRHLQREVQGRYDVDTIIGKSPHMIEVYKTVVRAAPARTSVLILGESGTGKELVARALHHESPRASHRFVPVNVSAIPEGLLESELFGHVRGAFTGATSTRRGLFDEAHGGTLFLDEIGDLSLPLQAKLLRVIQDSLIKPVGGNEEHKVDVRLVAATHRNLEEMKLSGRFREDLYYRLNVVSISLPPLRERPDDIEALVEHFLRKYGQETGRPVPQVSDEALQMLKTYGWPGNVRELENVVERAVLLSAHGSITPDTLPPRLHDASPLPEAQVEPGFAPLETITERYVERVLDHTKGNRTRAAQILGISRRTLHRMARRRRDAEDVRRDDPSHHGNG